MKVLVVEDDERLARFLRKALEAETWSVEVFSKYEELRDLIESPTLQFDVAILDRMLGPHDSLSLLKGLRSKYPLPKILFLSAVDHAEERARAIEEGADDYMGKPYSLRELVARLRALQRRVSDTSSLQQFRELGNLKLDLLAHVVTISGKKISLSAKEFKILSVLMERPGAILSRYQMLDRVWEVGKDLESNVVEATMHNLRKTLEESGSTLMIRSRRGTGYWVEAENAPTHNDDD